MSLQQVCLIHYHEIGLKGHNRKKFEQRLIDNVKAILPEGPVKGLRRISGRDCIFFEKDTSSEVILSLAQHLARIPGVARISCGYRCEQNLETMYATAIQALQDAEPFTTFKVQARRAHTDFTPDSMELNQLVGAALCRAFPEHKVQMRDPEVTVRVEVIEGSCYIYAYSIAGIGGLPVGSSGKVVALLSSGIDSPVALWKLARRGAVPIGVHFSGRPETVDTSEFLVEDIAEVLEQTGCIAKVYIAPIGTYQKEIALSAPPSLRVILYRRLMFRVAEAIAHREGAKALVTGESLGQVASQTIENITATNAVVSMPVFRPLIGSDKLDIIKEAEELGTFAISSQDAPDCCTLFMPRKPETHAKLDQVEEAEAQYPIDEWVSEILDQVECKTYDCPAYKPPKQKK